MTYNDFKENSDKEFDEKLITGKEFVWWEDVPKIKSFLAARDQALIKVLRECVPLKMGKANLTGHDMITQFVDGFNASLSQTHASIEEFLKEKQ